MRERTLDFLPTSPVVIAPPLCQTTLFQRRTIASSAAVGRDILESMTLTLRQAVRSLSYNPQSRSKTNNILVLSSAIFW